ncbi:MAG TPA: hypothetical protein VIQ05_02575 [Tardiphaga sp.]
MMASIFFTERLPGTSTISGCTLLLELRVFAQTVRYTASDIHALSPRRPGVISPEAGRSATSKFAGEHDGSEANFSKSRVHAKLIRRLFLEHYQITNMRMPASAPIRLSIK